MKYIRRFNEELKTDLVSVDYEKEEMYNEVDYRFNLLGYYFTVTFTKKSLLLKDNEVYFGTKYDDIPEICDFWVREFKTDESDFETLNISSTSPLTIFGAVSKITEDFINEYSPSVIKILHITSSRYRVNLLFMNKLNIDGNYRFTKMENKFDINQPSTLIYKNEFSDYIERFKSDN